MALYKYMTADGAIRLFRKGMLRFTQPSEFNDPFEMQPFLKGLADESTLENQFHNGFGKTLDPQIDEMFEKLHLTDEQRATIDRQALKLLVQAQAPRGLELFKSFARIVTPVISGQIYKTSNENLGMLCLTEKPENLLMWAHYADHHRGAVIEFDEKHEFFSRRVSEADDFRHFRKVVYAETRPNLFLNEFNAVDFFYFKSKEWQYEQEWRLIVPLNDWSDRIEDPPNLPICLFSYPPACISAIAVGVRMPQQCKLELSQLLRNNPQFRHIKVEQIELDQHVFALRRRAIEPDELDEWLGMVAARTA
jgi:Protein of unknown function (DUF2971)